MPIASERIGGSTNGASQIAAELGMSSWTLHRRLRDLSVNFHDLVRGALDAATVFLVTFTDLLATLIGEALTAGLMNSAWPDRAPRLAAKEPEQ